MKINAISQDFPLVSLFSNKSQYTKKSKRIVVNDGSTNLFNNESPDFIRLDSMKEDLSGYRNPFLDEVIKVDRSEELKKMEKLSNGQIKFIDKIKSRRHFSQDPRILKYIQTAYDRDICAKRDRINIEKLNPINISPVYESCTENNPAYEETIKVLNRQYSPKLNFKVKATLLLDNLEKISLSNTEMRCSSVDKCSVNKLQVSFDPKKSSYLSNFNDYRIGEGMEDEHKRLCHFNKKEVTAYNCIKDRTETISPEIITNKRWDLFYENYLLLLNKDRMFLQKGGLFSEFSNKNKAVFKVKRLELKLKKEKEKSKQLEKPEIQSNPEVKSPARIKETSPMSFVKKNRTHILKSGLLPPLVENANKVIEEKGLFKLKHYYMKANPNHNDI